jgi:hypothetical protein
MSSIDSKGENEYYDDESNIVGKSEESIEEDQELSEKIKREIRKDKITQENKVNNS